MQSDSSEDDVWVADSGVSCHMTHDRTRLYNLRPSPPGRETITVEDRQKIQLDYIGNMDVILHGKTDQRITLIDVGYVSSLGYYLYSPYAVQRTQQMASDASGTHIIGKNLTVPHSTKTDPLSSLGEIKFVGKTSSKSECRIVTPLAAAAPTPGLLKHGTKVDIYHFHASLAHTHASVLKVTAKQHGIHLTGELI